MFASVFDQNLLQDNCCGYFDKTAFGRAFVQNVLISTSRDGKHILDIAAEHLIMLRC